MDLRMAYEKILLNVPEGMQWAWARYGDDGRLEDVVLHGWTAVIKSAHPEIELPDNLCNNVDTSENPDCIIVNNLILIERSLTHPAKFIEDAKQESYRKNAEELWNNRLNNSEDSNDEIVKKAVMMPDIYSLDDNGSPGKMSILSVLENNEDRLINRIKNKIIAFFYGKISRSELIQLIESKTGMFNSFGRAMIDDSVKNVEASLVMQVDIKAYYKYILHNYFDCAMLDKEGEIYDKWLCLKTIGFHKKTWDYSKGKCRGLTFFTKDKSIKEQIEY